MQIPRFSNSLRQTYPLKRRKLYINSTDWFRQGNLVGLLPPLIYKNVIIPFTLYATLVNVRKFIPEFSSYGIYSYTLSWYRANVECERCALNGPG